MQCKLQPRQIEALQNRFGKVLDLRKEFLSARDYVLHIHTGRPYKNFGRFFWNWCRRAEETALGRTDRADRSRALRNQARREMAVATAPPPKVWTREELLALLDDELPQLRQFAREELDQMEQTSRNDAQDHAT